MLGNIVKKILGNLYSWLGKVKAGRNIYIGPGGKIVNRGRFVCGDDVVIRPRCNFFLAPDARLSIMDGADIGSYTTVSVVNSIEIGPRVLVSPNCYIADHNHDYSDPHVPVIDQGVRCAPGSSIRIGSGVWIGKNAVIVGNVRIGRNSVVGANSVVTRDIPDYCIAAGVPARVIKKYDFDLHAG